MSSSDYLWRHKEAVLFPMATQRVSSHYWLRQKLTTQSMNSNLHGASNRKKESHFGDQKLVRGIRAISALLRPEIITG